jgi:hypothetical protein
MQSIRRAIEAASGKLTEHPEAAVGTDAAATAAGPLEIRVRVELAAPDATEGQLREIVERAEARSPVRDALVREVLMTTEIFTNANGSRRGASAPQRG